MRATLWLDLRRPWAELLATARQAEAAGWDGVGVADTCPGAREPWTVAGAMARAVPRLRLAVVVDDDRGRHPAVVAKLAGTVDRVSGGRLLLGLVPGAGPDAGARLAEGAQVVKSLAHQARTTQEGLFYRLEDAPLEPKPQQQPFPVMLVGGGSDLAARVADHWSLVGSPDEVASRRAELPDACARLGRDPSQITVSAPYPSTGGIDEWIVPDSLLGTEPSTALARILAEARSTL